MLFEQTIEGRLPRFARAVEAGIVDGSLGHTQYSQSSTAYDGENGFAISDGREHPDWEYQDTQDAQELYQTLENEVVPLFCGRDERGVPRGRVLRQKHALRTLAWRFCKQRMVGEYAEHCFLPATGGTTCSFVSGVNVRHTWCGDNLIR